MSNIIHKKLTFINLSLIIFFISTCILQSAVDSSLDSAVFYEKSIENYTIKEQIEIYELLAKYHSKKRTSKSIDLLYKGNKLAIKTEDTLKIIHTEYLLGYVFSNFFPKKYWSYDSAKVHFFNALILLDDATKIDNFTKQKERYSVYLQLAEMYNNRDLNKSYVYYEKALNIADSIRVKETLLLYLHQKVAYITQKLRNHQKAIMHSLKVLELLDKLGKHKEKIYYFRSVGQSYFEMGNYAKALSYYFQELELRRELDLDPLNDAFLDKIANVYTAMGEYNKALDFYERALEIVENKTNLDEDIKKKRIAKYLLNIGAVYNHKNQFTRSLGYSQQALNTLGDLEDYESLKGKSIIYNNMAQNLKDLGKGKEAFNTLKKSEGIVEKIGIRGIEILTLTTIAEIYSSLEKFEEAENYLLKAKQKAITENNSNAEKNVYYLLYELYNKFQKYRLALENFTRYTSLSDSLLNVDMTNRLVEFQTVYEMEKRSQENTALKRANFLQREKARLERQSFLLVLFFTLLVMGVLAVLYHFRKRAANVLVVSNNTIEGQNARLLELNDNLRRSESYLRQSNNSKDKFISIIAHDLKNPMHSIGFSADLMINYYDKLDDKKKMNHLKGIYKTSNHAYDLLENLLHWARAQTKSMSYSPEMIDFGLLVKDVVDLSYSSAGNKNIDIINKISNNFKVYIDKNMIETVTRNLVSNAIKYCNENSTIEISSLIIEEYVVISIKDNGIGMSPSVVDKLFKIEEQISTPGTMKESGTGLGLLLCKEFVNINRGDIWADSVLGQGSVFNFTLPLNKKSRIISKELIEQKLKIV